MIRGTIPLYTEKPSQLFLIYISALHLESINNIKWLLCPGFAEVTVCYGSSNHTKITMKSLPILHHPPFTVIAGEADRKLVGHAVRRGRVR